MTAISTADVGSAATRFVTNPATGQPYTHGTAFTYERGCRCAACTRARELEERWLPVGPVLVAMAERGWSLHEAEQNFRVNLRKSEHTLDLLTTEQADKIATRLGVHPIEIWGLEVWGADVLCRSDHEETAMPDETPPLYDGATPKERLAQNRQWLLDAGALASMEADLDPEGLQSQFIPREKS